MVVSSNTLFQFTKYLDTIIKILESHGFWPRYCIEFGWTNPSGNEVMFAVPQCCFCDIPLSAIHPHMKFYGNYGIGMTKKWGVEQSLSPVLYVLPKSHLIAEIKSILRGLSKDDKGKRRILAFLKKYKGINYRFDGDKKEWGKRSIRNFYDEREWRYVPSELSAHEMVVKVEDKETFDVNTWSQKTRDAMCTFEARDVKYLIVNTDEERMSLIEDINHLNNWDEKSKSLLCSKIILNSLVTEDI